MEYDKDLAARQEARNLAKAAAEAQKQLGQMPQEKLDAIVEAVARAFAKEAYPLAELAVRETGFGNPEDKVIKNRFASETVAEAVRGMKTVGFLREDREKKLWEYGIPVGVIAAIVPSTNPTSTLYADPLGTDRQNILRLFGILRRLLLKPLLRTDPARRTIDISTADL